MKPLPISAELEAAIVDVYNRNLETSVPGYYYHEVDRDQVIEMYGYPEDIPTEIQAAIGKGENVISWSTPHDAGLWTMSEAPGETLFYAEARRMAGYPDPVTSVDSIMSPFVNEKAASSAFTVLAESEGWQVHGSYRYLTLIKTQSETGDTIKLIARISNHSRQATVSRPAYADDVNINLAPKYDADNAQFQADSFEEALWKLRCATLDAEGNLVYVDEEQAKVEAEKKVLLHETNTTGLKVDQFVIIASCVSSNRLAKFANVLEALNQAQALKEIPNARYKEYKEFLGGVLTDVFSAYRNRAFPNFHDLPNEVSDTLLWEFSPTSLNDCMVMEKKARRLDSSGAHIDLIKHFYAELRDLLEIIDQVKEYVIKRPALNQEQKEKSTFIPPKSGSSRVLYDVLKQLTEKRFIQLRQQTLSHYERVLQLFIKGDEAERSSLFKDPEARQAIIEATTFDVRTGLSSFSNPVSLVANASNKLLALADKSARSVQERFIAKQLIKLGTIVEAKGNFKEAVEIDDVKLLGLEGLIKISFTDQSEFVVKNSLVSSTSSLGNRFFRFPLTFHSVKLPGGIPMSNPSEERMHTIFVKSGETRAVATANNSIKWASPVTCSISSLGEVSEFKERYQVKLAHAEEAGNSQSLLIDEWAESEKPIRVLLNEGAKPLIIDGEWQLCVAAYTGRTEVTVIFGEHSCAQLADNEKQSVMKRNKDDDNFNCLGPEASSNYAS